MQIYKKLATKLFNSQKNNFGDFSQTTNTLQFADKLQPKTYYETYKELYYGAKFFAVLAQLATAISSYSFFVDLFEPKITHQYALNFCVVVVLAIIETMKYLTLNKALLGLFSLPAKPNYALLSFALILSICSIYASVIGGGNLGIDTAKVDSVKSEFDSEIATLRSEITDIKKRNTYKGNTYIVGKEKKLLHSKEATIQALQAKKDNELIKVSQVNENNANTFKIGFGLFDILFILCSFYTWYFTRCVVIEKLANDLVIDNGISNESSNDNSNDNRNNATNPVIQPVTQPNLGSSPNPQPAKIGFTFTNLDKDLSKNDNENNIINKINNDILVTNITCLHCGTVYVKKHHKQKYCNENCRIAAWETKTNVKLHTHKK